MTAGGVRVKCPTCGQPTTPEAVASEVSTEIGVAFRAVWFVITRHIARQERELAECRSQLGRRANG